MQDYTSAGTLTEKIDTMLKSEKDYTINIVNDKLSRGG